MISHVVVLVEELFSDQHTCLNRGQILWVDGASRKMFVDEVHRRNYFRKVRSFAREKKSSLFENLSNNVSRWFKKYKELVLHPERLIVALRFSTHLP